MSLWYDVKKKIYTSSANDNWYISYAKKMCDKISSSLSAKISNHISGTADRHLANDIDYSESKTLKVVLDEEISSRKSADASNLAELKQELSTLQNSLSSADNEIKKELLANDNSILSQTEADINALTTTSTQLQSKVADLDADKVDKIDEYGLIKIENSTKSETVSGNEITKDTVRITQSDGTSCSVPMYTSDLTNDKNFVDSTSVRTILPNVKTSLPRSGQLSLNTIYDLRHKTASDTLSLNLPSGDVGNFIQVDFVTGDSVPTLLMDTSVAGFPNNCDFSLEPNTIYSLFFDWSMLAYEETTSGLQTQIGYTYGWRFNYAEYTYKNESE